MPEIKNKRPDHKCTYCGRRWNGDRFKRSEQFGDHFKSCPFMKEKCRAALEDIPHVCVLCPGANGEFHNGKA